MNRGKRPRDALARPRLFPLPSRPRDGLYPEGVLQFSASFYVARSQRACEFCVAVGMAHTATFTERNRLPIPHRGSLADARDDSTAARDVIGPIAHHPPQSGNQSSRSVGSVHLFVVDTGSKSHASDRDPLAAATRRGQPLARFSTNTRNTGVVCHRRSQ